MKPLESGRANLDERHGVIHALRFPLEAGRHFRHSPPRSTMTVPRTDGMAPGAGGFEFGAKRFRHGSRQLGGVRRVGMNAERLGTQNDVLSGRGDYFAFVQ